MPLEQQVVSLGLAKRLKELGVKQKSLFRWTNEPNGGLRTNGYKWQVGFRPNPFPDDYENYSAFTASELGEMLPQNVNGVLVQFFRTGSVWGIGYHDVVKEQYADTEADARAKMLIYLIENSLIPLPING